MKKIIKSGLFLGALCACFLLSTLNVSAKDAAQGDELVIVAHVTVKPEYKEVMLDAFKAVVKGTRQEPGNVSYVLHEHVDNPLKFTFVEVWKSQEAIDAHNNSSHFKTFAQTVDGKASLEVYTLKEKF